MTTTTISSGSGNSDCFAQRFINCRLKDKTFHYCHYCMLPHHPSMCALLLEVGVRHSHFIVTPTNHPVPDGGQAGAWWRAGVDVTHTACLVLLGGYKGITRLRASHLPARCYYSPGVLQQLCPAALGLLWRWCYLDYKQGNRKAIIEMSNVLE